jgi:hypothetical protein
MEELARLLVIDSGGLQASVDCVVDTGELGHPISVVIKFVIFSASRQVV